MVFQCPDEKNCCWKLSRSGPVLKSTSQTGAPRRTTPAPSHTPTSVIAHAHTHAHARAHAHAHARAHTRTHTHTQQRPHTHTHKPTHMHSRTRTCTQTCTRTRTSASTGTRAQRTRSARPRLCHCLVVVAAIASIPPRILALHFFQSLSVRQVQKAVEASGAAVWQVCCSGRCGAGPAVAGDAARDRPAEVHHAALRAGPVARAGLAELAELLPRQAGWLASAGSDPQGLRVLRR